MMMKKLGIASTVTLLLSIALAGCTASKDKNNAPLTADQTSAKTRLETQMQAVAQTAQTYHAMDSPALLGKLLDESKAQKEPFNSPAYRELKGRTDVDSKALTTLVNQNANASGLLPLLLLRRLDNKSYLAVPAETRAKILTEALGGSKYFNTWGLPNFYIEEASHAMIESGKVAVPALKRMLSDTRPAPVFGSQEYMVYKQYNYRLCDYALYFLEQIDGKTGLKLPVSPAERDTLIKAMSK
jgi:hypothetical protein